MSNHIDRLTDAQSQALYRSLETVFARAGALLDTKAIADVLNRAGATTSPDDLTDMGFALGLEQDTLEALIKATHREDGKGDLIEAPIASFFLAVVALTASAVGYTLNPNDTRARAGVAGVQAAARQAFYAITTQAVRETAARMFSAQGSVDSRVSQIVRIVGLTPALANSLNAARDVLFEYLNSPTTRRITRIAGRQTIAPPTRTADPARIITRYRAALSAPQRRMLAKAMTDALTEEDVERLLSRHASAMLSMRAKAAAGFQTHFTAEEAKRTAWQIAQRVGILPADQRREWETAGDERVRHTHAEVPGMNPGGVPLDQPFKTHLGDCMAPPLETNCRCKAVLV